MRGRHYFGPGFWKGGPGPGWGQGMGNASPFCRFFPWLPRRRWAAPGSSAPGHRAAVSAQGEQWDEADVLKEQAGFLQQRLDEINKRLSELGQQK